MTVAADELARIGSMLVEWRREDALRPRAPQEDLPQPAREVSALREALQPIIGIVIKLGADLAPGTDAHNDSEWSAVVAMRATTSCPARPAAAIVLWTQSASGYSTGSTR